MSQEKAKVYRVEVLADNVHKYSSTTVEGGGGYINTVNGQTFGQTREVYSTVQHHVDQDIWVKDYEDGREFQINLKESAFPVRPGHVLRVVFDQQSGKWERLFNETTGQMEYGQGFANPEKAKWYRDQKYRGFAYAVGLTIPMINCIVGLVALGVFFSETPRALYGVKLPGAGRSILFAILAGCGIFLFSWLVFVTTMESRDWSGFSRFFFLMAYTGSLYMFLRFFSKPWVAAAEFIERRSKNLDKLIKASWLN